MISILNNTEPVWMSHGDKVTSLPKGFEVIAESKNAPFAAVSDEVVLFMVYSFIQKLFILQMVKITKKFHS